MLYNVDTDSVTALHVPILSDPKEGANIDLLTDTDPWSNLKVATFQFQNAFQL